jgi:hypothetical protein
MSPLIITDKTNPEELVAHYISVIINTEESFKSIYVEKNNAAQMQEKIKGLPLVEYKGLSLRIAPIKDPNNIDQTLREWLSNLKTLFKIFGDFVYIFKVVPQKHMQSIKSKGIDPDAAKEGAQANLKQLEVPDSGKQYFSPSVYTTLLYKYHLGKSYELLVIKLPIKIASTMNIVYTRYKEMFVSQQINPIYIYYVQSFEKKDTSECNIFFTDNKNLINIIENNPINNNDCENYLLNVYPISDWQRCKKVTNIGTNKTTTICRNNPFQKLDKSWYTIYEIDNKPVEISITPNEPNCYTIKDTSSKTSKTVTKCAKSVKKYGKCSEFTVDGTAMNVCEDYEPYPNNYATFKNGYYIGNDQGIYYFINKKIYKYDSSSLQGNKPNFEEVIEANIKTELIYVKDQKKAKYEFDKKLPEDVERTKLLLNPSTWFTKATSVASSPTSLTAVASSPTSLTAVASSPTSLTAVASPPKAPNVKNAEQSVVSTNVQNKKTVVEPITFQIETIYNDILKVIALQNNKNVGFIQYNINKNNEGSIGFVEISSADNYNRGICTNMLKFLLQEYPNVNQWALLNVGGIGAYKCYCRAFNSNGFELNKNPGNSEVNHDVCTYIEKYEKGSENNIGDKTMVFIRKTSHNIKGGSSRKKQNNTRPPIKTTKTCKCKRLSST